MQTRRLRRRTAPWLVIAGVGALAASATAHADVTGKVVSPAGVPVPTAQVELRDATGRTSVTYADEYGSYRIPSAWFEDRTAPFTATATGTDYCRPYAESDRISAPLAVSDGDVLSPVVDVRPLCGVDYPIPGEREATAHVDAATGTIYALPNGVAQIQVPLVPLSAKTISVTLPDGTELGRGTDRTRIGITTPGVYSGPVHVRWSEPEGPSGEHVIGTITAGPVAPAAPALGNFDLAAIIDVSGSMLVNDPDNRRLDATHLLIELASPGDRLLATGFDDDLRAVFPRTTIVNASTRANLRAAAKKAIGNYNGTNYNVAFEHAFTGLTADPAKREVPKGAIFLTDGGHNAGAYDNGHLRFAHNGTQAAWPVCVVQLGKEFKPADEARLRRIAADTGGRYLKAPNNAQLESLYFQCRGATTGQKTVVKRTQTFRVGQQRTIASRVAKGQRTATFFVSWGKGRYKLSLRAPGRAKPFTRTTGKNVRLVKGRTFQYFQVRNPKPGTWRLQVKRLPTGGTTDTASTSVSVQRKR